MQRPSNARFIGLTILTTVISALLIFPGGPLLRVLRNVFGPIKYWSAGILLCTLFWLFQMQPLALLMGALWLTIGIYNEFEENGSAGLLAASLAVGIGSALLVVGGPLWARAAGIDLTAILHEGMDAMINQYLPSRKGAFKEEGALLIGQIPSIVVLLLMTTMASALIFDRKVGQVLGLRYEKIASHMRLLDFKNPDFLIWLMMISFLFSFLKIQPLIVNTIATNVFNVIMGLYFFQGLAVLEVSFLTFRIGNFTRFLLYFIVVGQLFFLLSIVGVIDYWADFRARLKRQRSPEGSQKKNEEHV